MAATPTPLTDEDVMTAVSRELESARRIRDQLGTDRATAYRYYMGEPFGNEVPGQSKVVSQLVMEVVDSLMPDIIKVFCGGDKVVEFVARKADDVPLAEQATEICNYIFFTQNPGFLLLYEAIKDALLQKTGAWKYWWEDEKKVEQESYQGLNEGQLLLLLQDPQVEIVQASPSMMGPMQPPMPPAPAQAPAPMPMGQPPGQPPMQGGAQPPQQPPQPQQLFDVVLKRTKQAGHVCIETIPPDELLVSARGRSADTQRVPFIAHETPRTLSQLVEMGYPLDVVMDLPLTTETALRSEDAGERAEHAQRTAISGVSASESTDPMQREVLYCESWIVLDADGDGISELRRVCSVGTTILANELTERVPIAAITPKIMPHEFFGVSLADDTCDLQLAKSTVWRQVMNSMYLSNFPRYQVVEGMASANTYPDLMAPDPGRPIRVKSPGAVTPFQTPFVGEAGMQMLEYIEQEVEGRTPVSRYYQGISPDAVNKTATGVNVITSRSQARAELICRTFAETGIKDLFRGILWLLGKYQHEELIVRLNGEYVPIDPRAWATEYDMTVNVGLGTGSKQEQLAILQVIAQAQQAAVAGGGMGTLVTPKNIYNLQSKIAILGGFKDPAVFWNEPPDPYQPPPPKPDPQVESAKAMAQGQVQAAQIRTQGDLEKAKNQTAVDDATKRYQILVDAAVKLLISQRQTVIEQQKINHEASSDHLHMIMDAVSRKAQELNGPGPASQQG